MYVLSARRGRRARREDQRLLQDVNVFDVDFLPLVLAYSDRRNRAREGAGNGLVVLWCLIVPTGRGLCERIEVGTRANLPVVVPANAVHELHTALGVRPHAYDVVDGRSR